jgi:hypothetical protein
VKSKFDNLLRNVRGEEPSIEEPAPLVTKPAPVQKAPQPKPPVPAPVPVIEVEATKETKRRGRPPAKHSDPDFVQATAYIRKETHRGVKIELLRSDPPIEFSELVEQLLASWLSTKK